MSKKLLTIEEIGNAGVITTAPQGQYGSSPTAALTPDREPVLRCKEWIKEFCTPYPGTESYNRQFTSYNLKHCVERWTKKTRPNQPYYVPNGAFIIAAIELGFRAIRVADDSWDAYFGMKFPANNVEERELSGFVDGFISGELI